MTEKERKIIEKLKALIKDTPYEGEKQTALNVLKNYCLKHGINETELETKTEQKFTYKVKGLYSSEKINPIDLFIVIARHYFKRQGKDFYKMGFEYYSDKRKNETHFYMTLPPSDFINLIAEYEFYAKAYKKAYKKQLRDFDFKFYRAFLMKHDLLFDPDPNEEQKELSEEEIEKEMEVTRMSEKITKSHYFKQIK